MNRPHDVTPPNPWDIIVRVTHWVVAGVVVANALFTKGGGTLHVWLGWIGMAFLAVRLVWGIVGSPEARFAAFPPRPIAALSHVNRVLRGRVREYPSHNPAGAMMIYVLWLSLATVMGTGLVLTKGATPWEIGRQQAAVAAGDWSALATDGGEEGSGGEKASGIVGEIHQIGGNLLIVLAVIHLAGVALESVRLQRNLVRPMIRATRD
ncbi:MAG TPA: cytochrome b/b6 domain-containing protein [Albidovulum sp.]|uniref:cytochrome b/b6 domain-containing protein n=1 Tax=Albidovulum sp. TaxID=1872424 RepID=UPI002D0180EE|nr:cytochrome b/b6 domain-containing protein [Albidovulum sp.]